MVEKEETFDQVLSRFLTWIKNTEATIGNQQTKTFITCGDWDLKVMLPNQSKLSKLPVPPIMTHWLNLKKVSYKLKSLSYSSFEHLKDISTITCT